MQLWSIRSYEKIFYNEEILDSLASIFTAEASVILQALLYDVVSGCKNFKIVGGEEIQPNQLSCAKF